MSRREDEVVNRRVVLRSTPAPVPRPDNFEIVPTGGAGAGRRGPTLDAMLVNMKSSAGSWPAA
jgi:hypothetical protein